MWPFHVPNQPDQRMGARLTPLQIIMLGKRMREAQRKLDVFTDNFVADMQDAEELEKAFDKAIEPYVDHARALELQEAANGK